MSSLEARDMAAGNPLSFLRVSKPEIDLPPSVDPHAEEVYQRGRENFRALIASGVLRQDSQSCFYMYRQSILGHSQIGLVAVASCEEYLKGIIKKHELTRPDKENDRVRHIEVLNAQTGPAFLTYRAQPEIDAAVERLAAEPPVVDFVAGDGVRHTGWVLQDAKDTEFLENAFARLPRLYIADGHHRSAAAARVYQARQGAGQSGWFLSVIFPHNQMRILPYNRVVKDLNGHSPEALLRRLAEVFEITSPGPAMPGEKNRVSLWLEGGWYGLTFRAQYTSAESPVERLDAALLQKHVLQPIFGIDDPRTSKRVQFVGGIRGTGELERLVKSGEHACAFSMYPTGIEEMMEVADADEIMPPKSTWFEPKLRDAMFCHLI